MNMSASEATTSHVTSNASNNDTDEGINESFSRALRSKYKGVFKVAVENLIPTSAGRPLREDGVRQVMASIAEDGWVETSMPVVTLDKDSDEGQLSRENSRPLRFRVIDGNHRVASLKRFIAAEKHGKPKINRNLLVYEIDVHVYVKLGEKAQRIIADREYKSNHLMEQSIVLQVTSLACRSTLVASPSLDCMKRSHDRRSCCVVHSQRSIFELRSRTFHSR